MAARLVGCTKCRAPLPPDFYNLAELCACPACGTLVQVEVFPAALRPTAVGSAGEAVLVEGEASCFYHPAKKAVVPCASCGRFLCAVCDVDLGDQHLCPACVESGRRKGRLEQLENRRTLYDSLALAVAIYPIIAVWTTIIGAPIAIYLSIRYWNAPSSAIPRSKWRFIVAIILALIEIGVWVAVFIAIFHASPKRH
jgi:hypothetical protein